LEHFYKTFFHPHRSAPSMAVDDGDTVVAKFKIIYSGRAHAGEIALVKPKDYKIIDTYKSLTISKYSVFYISMPNFKKIVQIDPDMTFGDAYKAAKLLYENYPKVLHIVAHSSE